jgi:hypothetical protein
VRMKDKQPNEGSSKSGTGKSATVARTGRTTRRRRRVLALEAPAAVAKTTAPRATTVARKGTG